MKGIEKLIGQKVTLHGTARDAKAGAVIITSDRDVIYIKGLASWSSELTDKLISVSGILKKEKLIPNPTIDDNGAISSGASGDQLVLEEAEFY
ncbi:MAG: hypothetical protein ACXAEU_15300 [Candidatus Hodarchaeales archaeon]|jgi:hypothetical protein